MKPLIILCLLCVPISGQDTTSENQNHYFPHHLGDKWFYNVYGEDVYQWITEIIHDTIIDNESIVQTKISYYGNTFYKTYSIDSLDNVYAYNFTYFPENIDSVPLLEYKLNAEPGEIWLYRDEGGVWEYVRVDSVETGYVFGVPTPFMSFTYLLAYDTTDTASWIEYMTDRLAYGFGIVNTGGEGVAHFIRGAIIDGIAYGDTTILSITEEKPLVPQIDLYAYPNPFNSQVTIQVNLYNTINNSLLIYDIKGKLIYKLWEKSGNFSGTKVFKWYGKNLADKNVSSGMYFVKYQNDLISKTYLISKIK